MDEALIRYKDVEIHQQELCVLNDVNLELHKGEFVYLIGKVGSGKTSLLKTFYGELDVAGGGGGGVGYSGAICCISSASIFRSCVVSWVSYFRISSCSPTVRCMTILSLCSVLPGGRIRER